MFWEFYQQGQIRKAQDSAGRAELKAETSRQYIHLLEDRIANMALACQALWEVLEEKTDITQQDLLAKMEEVDLRDGQKDGKLSRVTDVCPSCGRKSSRRRKNCMYCGTRMESTEVFGNH